MRVAALSRSTRSPIPAFGVADDSASTRPSAVATAIWRQRDTDSWRSAIGAVDRLPRPLLRSARVFVAATPLASYRLP